MKSLIDWQIQSACFIIQKEKTKESGRGRRAEEIREEFALILHGSLTANQIDDVPLPIEEVASRDCHQNRRS